MNERVHNLKASRRLSRSYQSNFARTRYLAPVTACDNRKLHPIKLATELIEAGSDRSNRRRRYAQSCFTHGGAIHE
ncbi:MAG: hypothetical protein QOK27_642 [Gemmatimonadales bacterium]|jgi:hypothetical protein|nr:hypothetical protein [Gemmatimonadales bacterium]